MTITQKPDANHSHSNTLRLVFWEMTTACNLKCVHCRACPIEQRSPEDLSTEEGKALIDQIASFSNSAVVLSGGEPLVRPDVFEIARYGTSSDLRMLLATNGTMVTPDVAGEIASAGIQRVSVSIDGATAESHDSFRRIPGAFQQAWEGIANIKAVNVPYQINTTVSKHNIAEIPDILDLAVKEGAVALHLFLLVPTGCGKEIADDEMIDPQEYERILNWFYDRSKDVPIQLKATCAPHYYRIMRVRAKEDGSPSPQPSPARGEGAVVPHSSRGEGAVVPHSSRREGAHAAHGHDAVTKGCLAGSAVCFVSHKGEVYPCGYLPVSAGNIRQTSFQKIWEDAEVFKALRDEDNLQGKCGYCEFKRVCMGCRARAYADTGNMFAPEPYCVYEPKGARR